MQKIAKESFDFVFISGVLTYHDDVEALQALLLSHKLLEPWGLVLVRDIGVENVGYGRPPFGSIVVDGRMEIWRPPKGMHELFHQAGFECLRWRRPYPVNIPRALRHRWPNVVTNLFDRICNLGIFFPLWGALAKLNLRHISTPCYFVYLLKRTGYSKSRLMGKVVPKESRQR